jgi:hypothetical protein
MDIFIGKEIFRRFNNVNQDIINNYDTFYNSTFNNANAYFFGFIIIYTLSQGTPKALDILHEIQEKYSDDNIVKELYCKLLKYKITGNRLSYVYENKCNSDVDVLINTDFSQFSDVYFYAFY